MSKSLQIFNRGLFGAALAGGLAFSLGAHARTLTEDDIRYCAAFATKNQELQSVVKQRGCSFPPSPRFTDSYMQRYEWCMSTMARNGPDIFLGGAGIVD